VGFRDGQAGEAGQNFQVSDAAEQRFDQGLHRHERAVERAGVAPRLEVMRLGQMPMAEQRGLVLVAAEPDHVFAFFCATGQSRSAGAVKAGLPPRMTRVSTSPAWRALAKSRSFRPSVGFGQKGDRLADTLQVKVERVRQEMHPQGLSVPGHDTDWPGFAARSLTQAEAQARASADRDLAISRSPATNWPASARHRHDRQLHRLGEHRRGDGRHLAGRQPQPVIGIRASQAHHGLDCVSRLIPRRPTESCVPWRSRA